MRRDRQTGRHDEANIVTFHNFANAPNKNYTSDCRRKLLKVSNKMENVKLPYLGVNCKRNGH